MASGWPPRRNMGSATKARGSQKQPGRNTEPDALPQGPAHFGRAAGTGVLGDEHVDVLGHTHEKGKEEKGYDVGRKGRSQSLQ